MKPIYTITAPNSGTRPSPIEVVRGVAVGYEVIDKQLYVYGLRASDGTRLWRRPASTSATTQGVDVTVTIIGGHVAYFGPINAANGTAAPLIALDPVTGHIIAKSVAKYWTSMPHLCDAAQRAPCATADADDETDVPTQYQLDLHHGRLAAVPGEVTAYREVGPELVDPGARKPELIGRVASGRTFWLRGLEMLFGPGTTTDSGWDFERYETAYAGTVFAHLAPRRGRTFEINLATQPVTAGFRADSGALLWRQRGTSINCNGTVPSTAAQAAPVRCRYTGTIRFHTPVDGSTGTTTTQTTGFTATIEGFDPLTGHTTWSRPVGDAEALFDNSDALILRSDTEALLKIDGDAFVLDTRSGHLATAPRVATYWCLRHEQFAEMPGTLDGTQHLEIRFGTVAETCDADGRPTAGAPDFVPASMSSRAGTLQIVATPSAVIAYRLA